MPKEKKTKNEPAKPHLAANDWAALSQRLDEIEEAVADSKRKWWEIWLFPAVAWAAAIGAALITAFYSAQFQTENIAVAKKAEIDAQRLYGDRIDLYEKLRDLRVRVFYDFERFLAARGDPRLGAVDDSANELGTLLDARNDTIPSDVSAALRALLLHAAQTKLEFSKAPKTIWDQRSEPAHSEAKKLNLVAEAAISKWRNAIFSTTLRR